MSWRDRSCKLSWCVAFLSNLHERSRDSIKVDFSGSLVRRGRVWGEGERKRPVKRQLSETRAAALEPRIEQIAQGIAEEIDAENGDENAQPGI